MAEQYVFAMDKNMNRLDYIDALKGFGILLMVLGHMWFGHFNYEHYIYGFHMPLFFMISGYLFHPPTRLVDGIRRKMKSLLVPYFVFGMAYFVAWVMLNHSPGADWPSRLRAVLLVSVDGIPYESALWFLMTLFWAWLIYTLLVRFVKDGWIRAIIIIALSVVGALWSSYVPFLLPWALQNAMSVMVFFWLGDMYQKWQDGSVVIQKWDAQPVKRKICFLIIGLVVDAIFILKNGEVDLRLRKWGMIPATYFNAVAGTWLYAELFRCAIGRKVTDTIVWKFLRRIGRFSIVWLCVNHSVIRLAKRLIYALPWNIPSNFLVDAMIVVLSIVILYLIAELIMRTPLRVVVGKWKDKTTRKTESVGKVQS